MDIFFWVGLTSKWLSMLQQSWHKSLNYVEKYYRPKGNWGVAFQQEESSGPNYRSRTHMCPCWMLYREFAVTICLRP